MNVIAGKLFLTAAIYASLLSVFGSQAVADAGDDQFVVAANHYKNRRWKLAIDEFQVMIADHAAHVRTADAVFFLGESLMQLAEYGQARVQFDRVLNEFPTHRFRRQAAFRRGEAAHFADDDQQARQYLAMFVDQYGLDPLAAYAGPYLASRQLAAGEFRQALDTYEDSLRRFPAGPLAHESQYGRAQALQKLGQHADAIAAFRAIAADEQNRFATQARFQIGLIEYGEANYAEAEQTFRQVQQLLDQSAQPDPSLAAAIQYWLGLSLKGQEKWQAAADLLLATAEQSTDESKRIAAGYHAGDALLRAGLDEQAETQYAALTPDAEATEWADDIAIARLHLAVRRDDRSAVERFATMFERKFADSPFRDDATRTAGTYYLRRGEADAAVEQLQRITAAKGQPADATLRDNVLRGDAAVQDDFTMAIALQRSGKSEQALKLFAAVAANGEGAMRHDALLAQATILVERQDYTAAVAPLEQYCTQVPADEQRPEAVEQLLICLAQSQQFDKARAQYQSLSDRGRPVRPDVTLALAEAALAAGDRQWAAALFESAGRTAGASAENSVDHDVDSVPPQTEEPAAAVAGETPPPANDTDHEQKSLAGLAWSQYLDNAHEQSAATFEQLLAKYPDSPLAAEAAYTRGQALEKLDKLEPALEMYLLVIEKHQQSPQYETALLQAGTAYDALQHNDESLAAFDRLLKERPQSELADDALYQSAWVARELKRDDALARFARLHREHRDSKYWADATYRLAVDALANQRHEEASRLANGLIAAEPPAEILEHTLYLRGQIAAAAGDWPAIEAPLAQLIAQFPGSRLRLASEFWLAEATYQREDFSQAAARFDELARKIQGVDGSWPAMVPLRQAQLLARDKEWAKARQIAEQIPAQFPQFEQNYEVAYLIGRCHFAAAEFDEARQRFAETIKLAAGRKLETAAMAQWMIGESYFHQQDYDTAIREYFRVEALYGWPRWQAGALLQAGKCYEHLGQWSDAVHLYDRIGEQYPDTMFTDEAARRRVVASQRAGTTRQ